MYGKTSGTLHGGVACSARAAALHLKLMAAARELLVPSPGRAARTFELAVLKEPGKAEARELVGWTDSRANAFFFRSGPAATRSTSGTPAAWPTPPRADAHAASRADRGPTPLFPGPLSLSSRGRAGPVRLVLLPARRPDRAVPAPRPPAGPLKCCSI
ncbi:hypothetical protein [Streptomyces sp. NRRL S-31]|uniref:hypothetical protein n=1 Tax=Streptomyces sp. NRRL S-31 TaxID=1463898 RepID=UPI0004C55441|nr:hypothetical protein [Streptomyces sp. NRRL S-31]